MQEGGGEGWELVLQTCYLERMHSHWPHNLVTVQLCPHGFHDKPARNKF